MIEVTINDQARSLQLDRGIRVSWRLNGRGALELTTQDWDGYGCPAVGQEAVLWEDGSRIWAGIIQGVKTVALLSKSSVAGTPSITTCQCVTHSSLLDKRIVKLAVYKNKTCAEIIDDILTVQLARSGGTELAGAANNIDAGVTIDKYICDCARFSDVLDDLAERSGYAWWVDENQNLYFVPRDTDPAVYEAPFTITDAAPHCLELSAERTLEGFRDQQYIRVNFSAFGVSEQSFAGDDAAREWTLLDSNVSPIVNSLVNYVERITVTEGSPLAEVEKTFGIKDIDTGRDFYYSPGEETIWQDDGGTTLATGQTLKIQWRQLGSDVMVVADDPAIEGRAAVEPGTGVWDHYIDNSSEVDAVGHLAKAQAILDAKKQIPLIFSGVTDEHGLRPGQVLTIDVSVPDVDGKILVDQVDATLRDSANLRYTFSGSTTAYDDWIQTWSRILGATGGGITATVSPTTGGLSLTLPDTPTAPTAVTLAISEGAADFTLTVGWTPASPIGGNVQWDLEVRYYTDAACTVADSDWISIGPIAYDAAIVSMASGPHPNQGYEQWVKARVRGANYVGTVSDWTETASGTYKSAGTSLATPADATLTSAVLLNRFAENGVQKQRIGILGSAPDPIGSFVGVHVWADIPDGGAEAKWFADGSVLADGSHYATREREPLDLGRYTYSTDSPYLAIVVVDAPAITLTARFYTPSFAISAENPLHMVDEDSPSPSVTLELMPNPAVISGEEYAPSASGFGVVLIDGKQAGYQLTNNVWEYWLEFSWTGVPSSNTRFQELTGYEIVFLYDDGSYGYSGWIDPSQTGWTSDTWPCPVTASFTAYLCSSGAGGRNTIVEGITPKIDIVITRPVDATAGQEYAPLVTGQYAALNKVAAADTTNGIEVYYFSFGWDAPTDDALADVHVWVYATADDRWIEIGQFDAKDNGEHATDRWPLDGNVSYTMYFYSRARDGRENTHSDTVTPKVTGLTAAPSVAGTIKGNRISTATLGTALGVESDLLRVRIAGPLYADISNNLNIQISSDFVVSGGILTQNVIDLAKSVNFNTSEFTKAGGLLAVNTLAVNKLVAGDALFAGQATFAYNGGGKLTINSSGLTVADHNTAPTCTLTLAASGITVAKSTNSVQVTSSGVGIYGPSSQSVVITAAGVAISNGILTSATISGGLITGTTVTINSGGITTTINNVSDGSLYFGVQVADNSTGDCLRLYPRELSLFDAGYKMATIGSDPFYGHGIIELKDNSLQSTINISANGGVVSCREVRISSSTVIDLSRQIFATSFNPYVGGVQFYGTTAVQSFLTGCEMRNRLVRWSGSDLQYSNNNGEDWFDVGAAGIDLGYTFVPTSKTIAVYGGSCTSIG